MPDSSDALTNNKITSNASKKKKFICLLVFVKRRFRMSYEEPLCQAVAIVTYLKLDSFWKSKWRYRKPTSEDIKLHNWVFPEPLRKSNLSFNFNSENAKVWEVQKRRLDVLSAIMAQLLRYYDSVKLEISQELVLDSIMSQSKSKRL